ncbi:MAG: GTPase HflX [Succinivibrionaceae bacterium]|nr:GTPase HflX [Succinivibrionaceae bacterium]
MTDNLHRRIRAVLVHCEILSDAWDSEDLAELRLLAVSADLHIADVLSCRREGPDPRFYIGSGKIDELKALVASGEAELVVFNNHLSPAQERNISSAVGCKIIDRTALILEIFAQRARTYEGKLQVELAQLKYSATRLVRGWTHLERQKGGFGLRGGPGEKQLELDRRELNGRIFAINNELERVKNQRESGRKSRRKNEIPVLSLAGYTNAGKSTLFNRLTGAGVYAADQLFATLDPTLRRFDLPSGGSVVFADTVGFIRHLPHDLVAAFRATLQETRDANLILHVTDCCDDRMEDNIAQVNAVLDEIGAGEVPQLMVYNKIDLAEGLEPHAERDGTGRPTGVFVSAATGEGIDLLLEIVTELVRKNIVELRLLLPPELAGRIRSDLYELRSVVSEECTDDGMCVVNIKLPRTSFNQLDKKYGFSLSGFVVREQ